MEKTVTREKRRKSTGSRRMEHQDLCTTCNTGDECSKKRGNARPIHYCEEFDTYQAQPERKASITEPQMVNPEKGKYTGICVNCDVRSECASSAVEGGIWHCENYV